MVLVINNDEVEQVLTVENIMQALDEAYLDLDKGLTANRPRTFTSAPTRRGRFTATTASRWAATWIQCGTADNGR